MFQDDAIGDGLLPLPKGLQPLMPDSPPKKRVKTNRKNLKTVSARPRRDSTTESDDQGITYEILANGGRRLRDFSAKETFREQLHFRNQNHATLYLIKKKEA